MFLNHKFKLVIFYKKYRAYGVMCYVNSDQFCKDNFISKDV